MATVTGLTSARMLAIEAASITAARKEADELILTTHGGTDINVGNIKGGIGDTGPTNALAIGTVTEGPAAATITGAAPSQTLNLVLPKGLTGATGPTQPNFATAAARDAAITAPVVGMKCTIGSGATMMEFIHNGTAWVLSGKRTMGKAVQVGNIYLGIGWGTICTVSPTMLAGPAVAFASGYVYNDNSGATRSAMIQIFRDGAGLGNPINYYLPLLTGWPAGYPISIAIDVPAETAGSHIYSLYGIGSNSGAVGVTNGRVWVEQGNPE